MIRFYYNREPTMPEDWLSHYKESEFDSPFRSTVPLLDGLRREPPASFLKSLVETAGLDAQAIHLHLEYQVKPAKGRGTASHTDLMAIEDGPSGNTLAIEAKWTEPRYKTVAEWLIEGQKPDKDKPKEEPQKTKPSNRKNVLQGWLDLIEPYAANSITPEDCSDLIYQMIHRAASAADTAKPGGRPALAYLVFHVLDAGEPDIEHYRKDLRALRAMIGNPEGFPFFLASVPLKRNEAFQTLADLPKGPTTGELVRKALAPDSPPLFEFGVPKIENVGPLSSILKGSGG